MKNEYYVIGVMSGSSLDGIDIALVHFKFNKKWNFEIIKGDTFLYSQVWKQKLIDAKKLSGADLLILNIKYGKFIAEKILEF